MTRMHGMTGITRVTGSTLMTSMTSIMWSAKMTGMTDNYVDRDNCDDQNNQGVLDNYVDRKTGIIRITRMTAGRLG